MPKYYSPDGNIEVWEQKPEGYYTVEEWEEMHPPTPYVPTVEEQLAALDSQYNADKTELLNAYQTALIYSDTDRMERLKNDLIALDDRFDEDYEAIISEGEE